MRHIYGRNHHLVQWRIFAVKRPGIIPWYTMIYPFLEKNKDVLEHEVKLKASKVTVVFFVDITSRWLVTSGRNMQKLSLCWPGFQDFRWPFLTKMISQLCFITESSGKHVKTRRSEVPIPMIVAWLKNWLNWIPSPKILSLESKNPSTGYFLPKST